MENVRAREIAATLNRNVTVMTALSVVFLVVLAYAPAKAYFNEWRELQSAYNVKAEAVGLRPMDTGLKQIWRPEMGLTDRCTTCHVGMGAATALKEGGPLYGAHPEVYHDVARMGCTICHRGQGRATGVESGHGLSEHWEEPMLAKGHLEASCGPCHSEAVSIPSQELIETGAYLFEFHGCRSCHTLDGMGGTVGPDLSGVGLKGYDRDWHVRHLRAPSVAVEGSRMMSFGHLSDRDLDALIAFMDTLVGAPKLVRGKVVAQQQGCRSCHRIDGVGGDHGPDLSNLAAKPAADLDFTNVEGAHTQANWHRQHLRNPQKVSPGSRMPRFDLSEADEEALITYLLSLRKLDIPMEQFPIETVTARLDGRRDFPEDGEALYRIFCSACHIKGESRAMESLDATIPNVVNPDMLAVASPAYLRATLNNGRPGRDMPSWGTKEGGLNDQEVDLLVGWLESYRGVAPPYEEVAVHLPTADVRRGARQFRYRCGGCHGLDGEGTPIAPSLTSPEFQFLSSSRYLYDTITGGRADTAMPAHPGFAPEVLADIIAWIRSAAPSPAQRARMERSVEDVLFVSDIREYRATGSQAYGATLFEGMCSGCHGKAGQGAIGPAIGNPDFLRVASDGFLAGTMVLGRTRSAMRSFGPHGISKLSSRDIGDIITHLRSEAGRWPEEPLGPHVQGDPSMGQALFERYCQGCHGIDGAGKSAPALNNQGFLTAATDGFLQATIARGRYGTAMRGWTYGGNSIAELEPQEINDLVSFVRSWDRNR